MQYASGCPSLLDSVMFCPTCVAVHKCCVCVCVCTCVCMCVYACVCVCVCVCKYASVVFKNGKGSFTQCILAHMHKGV